MHATTLIPTSNARRYLGQFVKHFAHKLPTTRAETNEQGSVTFPMGACQLSADDAGLSLTLETDTAEAMAELKNIVERHLLRFAFRESLVIRWQG
jgi:hypothetical protein